MAVEIPEAIKPPETVPTPTVSSRQSRLDALLKTKLVQPVTQKQITDTFAQKNLVPEQLKTKLDPLPLDDAAKHELWDTYYMYEAPPAPPAVPTPPAAPSFLTRVQNAAVDWIPTDKIKKMPVPSVPKVPAGVPEAAEASRFDTRLNPAEERQFSEWKAKYAPKDSGLDYDLRGAFKAGLTPDPKTGHWPDTFKKPNHPTFSTESQYASAAPEKAGTWGGADRQTYIPPKPQVQTTPTPGLGDRLTQGVMDITDRVHPMAPAPLPPPTVPFKTQFPGVPPSRPQGPLPVPEVSGALTKETIKGLPHALSTIRDENLKKTTWEAFRDTVGTTITGAGGLLQAASLGYYEPEKGTVTAPVQLLKQLAFRPSTILMNDPTAAPDPSVRVHEPVSKILTEYWGVPKDLAENGTMPEIGKFFGTLAPWSRTSKALSGVLAGASELSELTAIAKLGAKGTVDAQAAKSAYDITKEILKHAGIQAATGEVIAHAEKAPDGETPEQREMRAAQTAMYGAAFSALFDGIAHVLQGLPKGQPGTITEATLKDIDDVMTEAYDAFYRSGSFSSPDMARRAADRAFMAGIRKGDTPEEVLDAIKRRFAANEAARTGTETPVEVPEVPKEPTVPSEVPAAATKGPENGIIATQTTPGLPSIPMVRPEGEVKGIAPQAEIPEVPVPTTAAPIPPPTAKVEKPETPPKPVTPEALGIKAPKKQFTHAGQFVVGTSEGKIVLADGSVAERAPSYIKTLELYGYPEITPDQIAGLAGLAAVKEGKSQVPTPETDVPIAVEPPPLEEQKPEFSSVGEGPKLKDTREGRIPLAERPPSGAAPVPEAPIKLPDVPGAYTLQGGKVDVPKPGTTEITGEVNLKRPDGRELEVALQSAGHLPQHKAEIEALRILKEKGYNPDEYEVTSVEADIVPTRSGVRAENIRVRISAKQNSVPTLPEVPSPSAEIIDAPFENAPLTKSQMSEDMDPEELSDLVALNPGFAEIYQNAESDNVVEFNRNYAKLRDLEKQLETAQGIAVDTTQPSEIRGEAEYQIAELLDDINVVQQEIGIPTGQRAQSISGTYEPAIPGQISGPKSSKSADNYQTAEKAADDFDDALVAKYGPDATTEMITAIVNRKLGFEPDRTDVKQPKYQFSPGEIDKATELTETLDKFAQSDREANTAEIEKRFEPLIPDPTARKKLVRDIARTDFVDMDVMNPNRESWRDVGEVVNKIAHYISENVTHDRPETAFKVSAQLAGSADDIGIQLKVDKEAGLGPSDQTIQEVQRWLDHLYPENPPRMPGATPLSVSTPEPISGPKSKGELPSVPEIGTTESQSPEVHGSGAAPTDGNTEASGGTEQGAGPESGGSPESSGTVRSPGTRSGRDVRTGGRGTDAITRGGIDNSGFYRITDADELGAGGPTTKFRDNLKAIRVLKALMSEERLPTPEERKALVRYVGWGGLSEDAFKTYNRETGAMAQELEQLLSPEEYEHARASVKNAHYTSADVIRYMWDLAKKLGFSGNGTILETSMGTGNFLGLAPDSAVEKGNFIGAELDPVTGNIAKYLYPGAAIRIGGYETLMLPDNSVDLAIGNVPFGDYKLYDPRYKDLKLLIHDYFFIKTLDKVRPGGLVMFITSKGTLDKANDRVRELMADKADLVAAYRLPNTAFKTNARTEVTTDIIILQKRDPSALRGGEPFLKTQEIEKGLSVNEYFAKHPENMFGKMTLSGSMYRGNEPTLEPTEDLKSMMAKALLSAPQGVMKAKVRATAGTTASIVDTVAPDTVKELAYTINDKGQLVQRINGVLTKPQNPAVSAKLPQMKELIGLREQVKKVIAMQLTTDDNVPLKIEQEVLGKLYDAYVKKHGILNGKGTDIFYEDPQYPLLLALENYQSESKSATKSAIFSKRTIRPIVPLETVSSDPKEGLIQVLADRGFPDIPFLSKLSNKPENEVIESLEKDNIIFQNPGTGSYEMGPVYLSGYVRDKLEIAREAAKQNQDYQRNVTALEAVQPEAIPIKDIAVKFGATWVPGTAYEAFVKESILGGTRHRGISVKRLPDGAWKVDFQSPGDAGLRWGSDYLTPAAIMESGMNMKRPTIWRTDSDNNKYVDQKATLAAREKLSLMKEEFQKWAENSPEWSKNLETTYNKEFNGIRLMKYDGSHLTLPGVSAEIKLRPHQLDGVWRIITDGRALLAHVVGSGKTYTSIAAGMELRRLGISKKNMFVVPNGKVEQWRSMFQQMYPAANILSIGRDDLAGDNRRQSVSRIATGDWDAVILQHSSFSRIPISPERMAKTIQNEMDELEETLRASKNQGANDRDPTIKALEKAKSRLEAHLKELKDLPKDDVINFDDLGIDYMFVDECFPYETPVMTDIGPLPIGKIVDDRLDVKVLSWNKETGVEEWKPILRWLPRKLSKQLVRVVHETGSFVCTEDHKVWTENTGYVRAKALLPHHSLRVLQESHRIIREPFEEKILQYPVCSQSDSQVSSEAIGIERLSSMQEAVFVPIKRENEQRQTQVLWEQVCSTMAHGPAGANGEKLGWASTDIRLSEGPEGQRRDSGHNETTSEAFTGSYCQASREDARTNIFGNGRERTTHRASDIAVLKTESADRTHDSNSRSVGALQVVAEPLQRGYCDSGVENCDRGGRTQSYAETLEVFRSAQNRSTEFSRVVRIEILEQGDLERSGSRSAESGIVYDIEVSDNHNYYVDSGVLVSNCHEFKNLAYFTKMSNISGLGQKDAKKGLDLKSKTDYLQEKNRGRGVIGMTGTPISNTMAEAYNMTRYIAPDVLTNAGIKFFDDWAANFGDVVEVMELSPDGRTYRARAKFSKFTNTPELMTMFRSFTDVKHAHELNLPTPELKGGQPQPVKIKSNDVIEPIFQDLLKRAEYLRANPRASKEKGSDNWLKLTGDGKKIALDARLYDADLPDHPDSKSNIAVSEIVKRYKSQKDTTQIVFADMYQDKTERFNLYKDMKRKLVDQGIPAKEIAIAHDFKNDEQLEKMQRQMNAGEIRVLFGSTAKIGVGLNVQKRLSALHDLDAPWRPDQLEQRHGRIVRQGNENKTVEILQYVTEHSFDAYIFQALETKARFIRQIMSGHTSGRDIDDAAGDVVLQYAELKAIASGNPDVKRKIELETQLHRLHSLESSHLGDERTRQYKIKENENRVIDLHAQSEFLENTKKQYEKYLATHIKQDKVTPFDAIIGGKDFNDQDELVAYIDNNKDKVFRTGAEATLYGVPVKFQTYQVEVREEDEEGNVVKDEKGKSVWTKADRYRYLFANAWEDVPNTGGAGLLLSVKHHLDRLGSTIKQREEWSAEAERQNKSIRSELGKPFSHQDELESARKELAEVNLRLQPPPEKAADDALLDVEDDPAAKKPTESGSTSLPVSSTDMAGIEGDIPPPIASPRDLLKGRSAKLPNASTSVIPKPPLTVGEITYAPEVFKISTKQGLHLKSVSGWRTGQGLAVADSVDDPGKFQILHIPSGMKITETFSPQQAIAIANKLEPLGDWTRSSDEIMADSAFKKQVGDLLAKESGQRGSIRLFNKKAPPPIQPSLIPSPDKDMEQQTALPGPQKNIWAEIKRIPADVKRLLTSGRYNEDIKDFPVFAERVRRAEEIIFDASGKAHRQIYSVLKGLEPTEYDVFRRIIFHEDQYETAARSGEDRIPLAGTNKLARLDAEINRLRGIATPATLDAVDKHHAWMEEMWNDFVSRGKADPLDGRIKYFPNMIVHDFGDALDRIPGLPTRMQNPRRMYLKERKGHQVAHEADYIKVMEQYATRAYAHNMIDDFIDSAAAENDVMPSLSAPVKNQLLATTGGELRPGAIYRHPDGRVLKGFQFNPGRVIYPVQAINEAVIRDAANAGLDELAIDIDAFRNNLPSTQLDTIMGEALTHKAFALGGQHKLYLLPIEIADKLEHFRENNSVSAFTEMVKAATKAWKISAITFAGPSYHMNNIIGDELTAYMEDLKSLSKQPEAMRILKAKVTPGQYQQLVQMIEDARIWNSTFFSSGDVPRAIDSPQLRKFRNPSGIDKYSPFGSNPIGDVWREYQRWSNIRESIPRVAKFLADLERIRNGMPVVTKGVNIDGLDPKSLLAAGKVAREFNRDFGAVSPRMRLVYNTFFPFMSYHVGIVGPWLRRMAHQGKVFPGDEFLLKIVLPLIVLPFIWNHFMYPDVEEKLPDWQKEMRHINTPYKDDKGQPQVIALETPVDIVMRWGGLHTLETNLDNVRSGKVTIEDAARQQLQDIFGFQDKSVLPTAPGAVVQQMLNPMIKVITDLYANKDSFTGQQIVSTDSPNLWGDRSKAMPQTATGRGIYLEYVVKKMISPYMQMLRASETDNPDTPIWNWFKQSGPFGWKKALGVRSVNPDAGARGDWYEERNWNQALYDEKMQKITDAYVEEASGNITKQERDAMIAPLLDQAGPMPSFVGADSDVFKMQQRPKYKIRVYEQMLRKEQDPEVKSALQDKIRSLRYQVDVENFENTSKAVKPRVGLPPVPTP